MTLNWTLDTTAPWERWTGHTDDGRHIATITQTDRGRYIATCHHQQITSDTGTTTLDGAKIVVEAHTRTLA